MSIRLSYLLLTLFFAFAFSATQGFSQDRPIAFQGAEIIPVTGNSISNGTLVIENGKIIAVGSSSSVDVPGNAEIIDATGQVIMPGLVDSHSHIGEGDGGTVHPHFTPMSGLWTPSTQQVIHLSVHSPAESRL